jgi:cell wall-associated NlpC family hydrolase
LQPGDLVFFARGGRIHHVGIYIGGGNFIHSPRSGDVVKITPLSSRSDYAGARRI